MKDKRKQGNTKEKATFVREQYNKIRIKQERGNYNFEETKEKQTVTSRRDELKKIMTKNEKQKQK